MLLMIATLARCEASPTLPSAIDAPTTVILSEADRLTRAELQWASSRISSYDFSVRVGCFCRSIPFILTFQVRHGISFAPDLEPEARERVRAFESIDALFEVLREALARDSAYFEVEYHPSLGYPMRAALEGSHMIRDDELPSMYRISGLYRDDRTRVNFMPDADRG
jgi:hypothetical protein